MSNNFQVTVTKMSWTVWLINNRNLLFILLEFKSRYWQMEYLTKTNLLINELSGEGHFQKYRQMSLCLYTTPKFTKQQ